MLRYLRIALLALLFLAALVFTWVNVEPVELYYLAGSIEVPLPVALWTAVLLGAILGILASAGRMLRLKRENLRLRRSARMAEEEVTNLRNLPIKDGR